MSEIFALSDKWLGIPVYEEFLGFSKMVKNIKESKQLFLLPPSQLWGKVWMILQFGQKGDLLMGLVWRGSLDCSCPLPQQYQIWGSTLNLLIKYIVTYIGCLF